MSETLAKLLRKRKTLAAELSTLQSRACDNACGEEGVNPLFDPKECVEKFKGIQAALRAVKTQISSRTALLEIEIPDYVPVPEAGDSVPLFQAILIRDDLKSQKSLANALINSVQSSRRRDPYDYRTEEDKKPTVTHFDFDEVVTFCDTVQEAIDAVDAQIQFVDNTK